MENQMNHEELMEELLEKYMTENGYKLWRAIQTKAPSIWNRPTSSTGKYHVKKEGYVPSVAEHTYEMLHASKKVMKLFNIEPNTTDADVLLLSVALHDLFKYGVNPDKRKYVDNSHDKIVADKIRENKEILLKLLSVDQFETLEEAIRLHQGRWSTEAVNKFDFNKLHPYTFFVHILDMLSANDCLRIGRE